MTPTLSSVVALFSASSFLHHIVLADEHLQQQHLRKYERSNEDAKFRVAIIGAGIAGASAAHHLRLQSASGAFHNHRLAITIYESSDEVGGQIKTDYNRTAWDYLELGASDFYEDDWCLVEAAHATKTALGRSQHYRYATDRQWIVDGEHYIEDQFCKPSSIQPRPGRWNQVKDAMKRGLGLLGVELEPPSPFRGIRSELKVLLERFQQFGRNETFNNVLKELGKCGLSGSVISNTASRFLESMNMTRDLQRAYVEPCIRDGFGLTLDGALGLHAVLSTGAERSDFSITAQEGNQEFIDRLIAQSEAFVQLNSQVVRVETGVKRRYTLIVASALDDAEGERPEYDAVIATGNSLASLEFPKSKVLQRRQVATYRTHIGTESSLEPSAIGMGYIPDSVFLTKPIASDSAKGSKLQSVLTSLSSWHYFFIDRTGCFWDDECDQFSSVFVADSSSPLSKVDLERLIRHSYDNSWTATHSWHRNLPVVNGSDPYLGDVQVEHVFFDASNTVLDTMEMSCRMGRNAAHRILEELPGTLQDLGKDNLWTGEDLMNRIQGSSR